MTSRIFQQHALAFGETPTQVVCQIDGNTVFSGSVTTLDEFMPALPDAAYHVDNIAWSWEQDAEFTGTRSITITVTGSPLLLGQTWANNPLANVANAANTYGAFYSFQVGNANCYDPLTDVTINGQPKIRYDDPALEGQWYWRIPANGTLAATLNVNAAFPGYGNIAP